MTKSPILVLRVYNTSARRHPRMAKHTAKRKRRRLGLRVSQWKDIHGNRARATGLVDSIGMVFRLLTDSDTTETLPQTVVSTIKVMWQTCYGGLRPMWTRMTWQRFVAFVFFVLNSARGGSMLHEHVLSDAGWGNVPAFTSGDGGLDSGITFSNCGWYTKMQNEFRLAMSTNSQQG